MFDGLIPRIHSTWRTLRHGADQDAAMHEEFRLHLELRADDLVAAGLPRDEAARQAALEFGGAARFAEEARESRGLQPFLELTGDLRHAIRSLNRSPVFTAAAVLTLALGVGANAAVFSLVNASLLRPLPFSNADRLVVLHQTFDEGASEPPPFRWWSYPQFEALAARLSAVPALAAYWAADANLSGGDVDPVQVRTEMISPGYFQMLGVALALGRAFHTDEGAQPGAHPLAVLGHALWEQRYGADVQILGRDIVINGVPLTVVGVAPAGFLGVSGGADLWIPHAMAPAVHFPGYLTSDQYFLGIIGGLAPHATIAQARAEMATVGATLAAAVRASGGAERWDDGAWGAGLMSLDEARRDPTTIRAQVVLAGAALFVLLIAMVNLSALLFARSITRARELAVRAALGAGRLRLVRQAVVEGGYLGVVGGALGTLLAVWCVHAVSGVAPDYLGGARPSLSRAGLGFTAPPSLDWRVVSFVAALALAAGMTAALWPALRSTGAGGTGALKSGTRGNSVGVGSLRRPTVLSAAAVTQVACALVLLAGAGLLLQGVNRLAAIDPGFNPDGIISFRLSPPATSYAGEAAAVLQEQVLTRVAEVPGVGAVTVGHAPFGGAAVTGIEFLDAQPVARSFSVARHYVGPDHFRTLGVPLLRGRPLTRDDRAGRSRVAVINETAAASFWPDEDPIGRRVLLGGALWFDADDANADAPTAPTEIVGIVGDVLHTPPGGEKVPAFYTSYLQFTRPSTTVMVRVEGDPLAFVPALRRAVSAVDPHLALHDIESMDARAAEALASERFATAAVAFFALLGLTLAAVGIYGVMAYSVAQRRREIGIQLALGATPAGVLRRVVGQGAGLAVAGLIVGTAVSLVASRALPALVAGVGPADPLVLLAVALILFTVALIACYLPARVATRVNPMETLSAE